jgi:D-alanyl-D-alanine carboxypeptidase
LAPPRIGWYILLTVLLGSCFPVKPLQQQAAAENGNPGAIRTAPTGEAGPVGSDAELVFSDKLRLVLSKALIPGDLSRRIMAASAEGPHFILDLLGCLEGDPYLRRLVDKSHALPEGYEPADLVELTGGRAYLVSRRGLMLRRDAADALETMAAAAHVGGVTLTAASSYRSYDYQVEVYARNVRDDGQEEADRVSARPGYSQHQTGLVLDFGPIDNSFAQTPAGRWIPNNAARFGWSLSFPDGYEEITGYVWESWHYRYVGPELAAFIDTYFDGIQQYALQFIHEWESTP